MLIRQTLLYLPAQFLAPAAQFASMIVWTWWLAPLDMGHYALITATQELAYLASMSWFSIYALRYLPQRTEEEARRRFLGTETTLMLLLSLPQVVAAVLTLGILEGTANPAETAAIIAAFYVTRSLNVHYAERARAQSDIVAYTILQCAGPVGGLAAGILFIQILGPTAPTLLIAYAVAQFAGTVLALPMIGAALRPHRIDREILKAAIAYGGPILLLSGLAWLGENILRYIVEHQSGAAMFGLMAVGWGLGRRCASFASMLVTAAAFPLAARLINAGDRTAALQQLTINAALLIGVLFPTVAGLAMVGDVLVDLAVAEIYRETTKDLLAVATLAGAIRFLHVHVPDQLLILDKQFLLAGLVDVVEIVASAVLIAVGLATYGLVGAVIGAGAASAIALVTSIVFARQVGGFQLPIVDALKVSLATALMVALLWLVPLPPTLVGLVASIGIGMAVYASAILAIYSPLWLPIARRRLATRAG